MSSTDSIASAASAAKTNGPGSLANPPLASLPSAIDPALLRELWRESGAESWGLPQNVCDRILLDVGTERNFGMSAGEKATRLQQAAFFRSLCLADLVLARACAGGDERAWEQFVGAYREALMRAAIAITRNDTLGRDLAEQLYAELYGLTARDGQRRCPLASYRGRGSLIGWLRTTLAQRHVDHHRRTRREAPLETMDASAPEPDPQPQPRDLTRLELAVEQALRACQNEERFLLAAYYLDGQTLLQVGRVLGVHEATISRKLQRATGEIRKRVLVYLQQSGMGRRAAEETLGADPRDLELNLKNLLQNSQTAPFQEEAEA